MNRDCVLNNLLKRVNENSKVLLKSTNLYLFFNYDGACVVLLNFSIQAGSVQMFLMTKLIDIKHHYHKSHLKHLTVGYTILSSTTISNCHKNTCGERSD